MPFSDVVFAVRSFWRRVFCGSIQLLTNWAACCHFVMSVEPLLAMTLAISLEHAPLVPQGVGSDKLIKDVRTIMYLVCLIVLLLSIKSCF
jgi:hypothetical protein